VQRCSLIRAGEFHAHSLGHPSDPGILVGGEQGSEAARLGRLSALGAPACSVQIRSAAGLSPPRAVDGSSPPGSGVLGAEARKRRRLAGVSPRNSPLRSGRAAPFALRTWRFSGHEGANAPTEDESPRRPVWSAPVGRAQGIADEIGHDPGYSGSVVVRQESRRFRRRFQVVDGPSRYAWLGDGA